MEDITAAIDRSKAILAGASAAPEDVLGIVRTLHKNRQFGWARKLLQQLSGNAAVMATPKLRLTVAQKWALSTYKDPDLQTDAKLRDALDILQRVDDLTTTRDQETLGLAGAVYKRMWEHTGRERQLETALAFYRRGFQQGAGSDYGYTGINAAFALNLLGDLESPDYQIPNAVSENAEKRYLEAEEIRRAIVATLHEIPGQPGNEWLNTTWWFLVTLGEAYFGLAEFPAAESWLTRALQLPEIADWERESSARQLARLMESMRKRAQRKGEQLDPKAEEVLGKFLGDARAALASIVRGKVGLALSGGGFRASLYHIGVLARLAELDLLRHVEYLSCVSGGSIIGAHYYLEVRKLLAGKSDASITRQHYVDIVQRLSKEFLAGVQRNIRMRIAAEWWTNLKIIFLPNYSRTKRAGELYEREIFSRVDDGEGHKERWLNELKINPCGEVADFRPKDHNWRRSAKVPILVLNATTLNTGHNWQFTASWMGEPPANIDCEIDANYRLRRMYYEEAPEPNNRVRLGHAVAASACVPGIFEPLPLVNLYERLPATGNKKVRPIVRLVDGGVHDNQGIAALLEQSCSVLLVSDASGQMEDQDFPSNGLLGVPLRANSVLQARVRVSQYESLQGRLRGGLLKGLMFVHLKKDLETTPVDWIDSQDPSPPASNKPLACYGVQKSIQHKIAAIRTDLDSFSEIEAYALMTDGYLMTKEALDKPILGFTPDPPYTATWDFRKIEPLMSQAGETAPLQRQLRVANFLAFKVWMLTRRLQIFGGVLVLTLLALLGVTVFDHWGTLQSVKYELTFGKAALTLVTTALSLGGLGIISKLINYRKTVQELLIGIGMAFFGFLIARLHLHVFDRLFLWQGKLKRLLPRTAAPSSASPQPNTP